jgi:adenine-specific DNA-methyltransferase
MAKSKKSAPAASVPVESHKHVADTRPNIPTRETAAFAADDGPQQFVINRDRSLDPQLVWKGKDEQDARPLEVPAVPIHVQEKIHPLAIIEDVKRWAKQGKPVYDLFADFNGLDDFEKILQFYQHDQHWTNRLILGDSLLVMASLAEKERLRGKVQCVYRPALRHQVRQQLAGEYAQARREGREGRRPDPPARADPGVS